MFYDDDISLLMTHRHDAGARVLTSFNAEQRGVGSLQDARNERLRLTLQLKKKIKEEGIVEMKRSIATHVMPILVHCSSDPQQQAVSANRGYSPQHWQPC